MLTGCMTFATYDTRSFDPFPPESLAPRAIPAPITVRTEITTQGPGSEDRSATPATANPAAVSDRINETAVQNTTLATTRPPPPESAMRSSWSEK